MLDSGMYTPSLRSPGQALCCRADGSPERSLFWKIQGTHRGAEALGSMHPRDFLLETGPLVAKAKNLVTPPASPSYPAFCLSPDLWVEPPAYGLS